MAGGLLQSTSFPWAVSSENNIRSKQSCNTKRAVKMMCSLQLQSPPMRLRTFSGLRGVKALDKIVKRRHDFHSGEGEREEEEEEEEEDEGEEEEEDEGEEEDEDWRTIEQREAMFKRFTKDAKKVIEAAEEEARRLDQKFVGAELIFLGLIAGEDYDTAAKVLKSMGINLEDARAQVEEIVGRGSGPESADQLSFTPRANHLFELSLEEARQLGHSYIDTEHLLLGLLRAGEGVNLILRNLGAYPHDIRTQVIRMVDKSEDTVDGYNKTPTLAKYGINLTILSDDLHPVVGMQPLISRVIQIFKKHTKNNPCLIGEPGVGKTSIAQGFAQSIQGFYINPKVISLDMRQLVQVGFEERLNKLMDELKLSGRRLILFIDDIHTLFEAGAAEGVVAAANFLKQALATGFQCIGATTPDGYRKHMENDPTLERLFQPIKVPEPTVAETIMILRGIRERYEKHHGISYTNEALIAAAQLSNEYVSDGFLPGKAINLIDEAGSFVACKNQLRDLYDRQLREELERVRMLRLMTKEDIGALSDKDLERVGMLWDLEMDCMIRISEIEKRIEEIKRTPSEDLLVTEADIKEVVSSGIFTSKNYL